MCSPPTEPATGTSPNDAPRAAEAAYAQPGPYGVGVVTLSLGDRDMELWYPADPADVEGQDRDTYFVRDFVPAWVERLLDPEVNPPYVTDAVRDVPAATDGPFPLVLFSHGFAGFRLTSTALTTHLASWGFVVIAPGTSNGAWPRYWAKPWRHRAPTSTWPTTQSAPRSGLSLPEDRWRV
ncbi:MAG: hypothetical protein R2789_07465 [Microthrixaceae bacterium]